jgi:hypothetical protein
MLLFDPETVGMSKLENQNDLPGGGSRKVRSPLGVHGVWVNGCLVHDGTNYIDMAEGPGQVLSNFN